MASACSYHKLPEPDDHLQCPYEKSHMVRFKKLPYHLMKCRKNHQVTFESCPFDARHHVPKPELSLHMATCPQRASHERDIARALQHQDNLPATPQKANTSVPSYDAWQPPEPQEDWESEISKTSRAGFTWTAPARDRQWLTLNRSQAMNDTLDSEVQQTHEGVQQPRTDPHVKKHVYQSVDSQNESSQHSLDDHRQPQPRRPPASPQSQQARQSSPGVKQHQKMQQPPPGMPNRRESCLMPLDKQHEWLLGTDFHLQPLNSQQPVDRGLPSLPYPQDIRSLPLHQHLPLPSSTMQQPIRRIVSLHSEQQQQQSLPGQILAAEEEAQTLQSSVLSKVVGCELEGTPIPLAGSVGQTVLPNSVANETINKDNGRSRIAANFQNAGVTCEDVPSSKATDKKATRTQDGNVNIKTHDTSAETSVLNTDSVSVVEVGQPSTSGGGHDTIDRNKIMELKLKCKKTSKKLKQISKLENKDQLDDEQKAKLSRKADLEVELDNIKKEIEHLMSTQ